MSSDTSNSLFFAALFLAAGLIAAPVLGELVVRPAFHLGWSTAATAQHLISNGFAF